jgi:type II secretory pathway pseudopilin PulG
MRSRPRHSGFSLVELLIALAASVFVMLGAAVLLKSQYRAFQSSSSERAFQEAGRIALEALTTDLRQAGLGVDPGLVFDFGPLAAGRVAAQPAGTSFATLSLLCTTGDVTCRDSIAGPDELVFLSRDPAFGKPLRAAVTAASTTLTVTGPLNAPLHQGQILQVACYTGNMTWAYVQVRSTVAADRTAATIDIPISSGNGSTFPNQNTLLADGCFSTVASADPLTVPSAAKVFKVDRFRYFIQSYSAAGAVVAWGTAGSRPWLMLDHGTFDTTNSGKAQVDPVAPDVEDLQVAYVFPRDTATPVVGAVEGARLASAVGSIDLASSCPVSSDDALGANRLTHHPGNIRSVQVGVVVRSAEPDLQLSNAATLPANLNRPALVGPDGYLRLLLQTSVQVRNLDARAPYYPFYSSAADQLNVGGG